MTTLQKKPAFLLMAKAAPLTSHPQFLLGLRARGLAPLLVTESLPPGVDASAEELARHNSALEGIQEVAVFTGSQQLAIQQRIATWPFRRGEGARRTVIYPTARSLVSC